jgi:di/tricarboxylate transporter
VQLAIRPRSVLECLDLAFLFCGRNWVGLFLASATGIVPIALFNLWLFQLPDIPFAVLLFVVAMEVPWATLLLTLYLGQVTFSRTFSLRRATRDFWKTLGRMLAFQVFVRGMCMALVVLMPVVFLGMYFVNEIILLEQTPLNNTWSRRSAMNSRALSHIVTLRIVDLSVLCFGTFLLSVLLRSISALWEDRFRYHSDEILANSMEIDWQLQVAFWLVIVFLTVFRFIAYLDCRIRREGWDVELKLRTLASLHSQREAAE